MNKPIIFSLVAVGLLTCSLAFSQTHTVSASTTTTVTGVSYDSTAKQILATALGSREAIAMLTDLTTNIGPRLSGSPNAARAVEWGKAKMTELGFDNVHTESCMVPHWVRG
ncbi:MAG TPA: hypothetical protein VKS81_07985, partial [Bacteroidota bacterium]|nr:hypothetical protein [Bacteroidota bacterium]